METKKPEVVILGGGVMGFSIAYNRATPTRLPASIEEEIKKELMLDRTSSARIQLRG